MTIERIINSIDATVISRLGNNPIRTQAWGLVERVVGSKGGFELGRRNPQKKDDFDLVVPTSDVDYMWFHRMEFVRNIERTRNYGRRHLLSDSEYHNVCVVTAKATQTTTAELHNLVSTAIANTQLCTLNNASLDSLSVAREELNLTNMKVSADLIVISINYYITIIGDECNNC